MKAGDKVIVVERRRLERHVVRDIASRFYVYANGGRFELHTHEEGITWCRGDDLNSKGAHALQVVRALSS